MDFITGGVKYSGFSDMRVFQSMQTISDAFSFEASSMPREIKVGADVEVQIGGVTMVKGKYDYLTKKSSQLDSVISGRDKTGVLVDSFPLGSTGEYIGLSPLEIMQSLCDPFGVQVSGAQDALGGDVIKRFNHSLDTQIGDIIAHLCNRGGFLASSTSEGDLVITNARDAVKSNFSFSEGQNIADSSLSIDLKKRHSSYSIYSQNKFGAFNESEKVLSQVSGLSSIYRPFIKISDDQYEIADADREALWRQQFMDGSSVVYTITASDILDLEVNTLVNVFSDYLGVKGELLVRDITYISRGDSLSTELTLVSPLTYGGNHTPNEFID